MRSRAVVLWIVELYLHIYLDHIDFDLSLYCACEYLMANVNRVEFRTNVKVALLLFFKADKWLFLRKYNYSEPNDQ